ncbi:MAG: hypothetical protein EPO65_08010 [Dehalococcoidia bacterium]|nr:MAG: hypothetical protein EPO65_08010 [Dehalococcoidia bacterium]
MATAAEMRQQLAANRAAFKEALSALGGKWEQAAPDDEWTPRKVAEHAIGADVLFSTRCLEAMQSKPSEWERKPLENLDTALATLDAATAIADRAYRYVEDHDLLKMGNPVTDTYPKNVGGILQNAIDHLAEHTATLKKRA